MAKNKNRERKQPSRSAAERGADQAKREAEVTASGDMTAEGGPTSTARKGRKKSFGHN